MILVNHDHGTLQTKCTGCSETRTPTGLVWIRMAWLYILVFKDSGREVKRIRKKSQGSNGGSETEVLFMGQRDEKV